MKIESKYKNITKNKMNKNKNKKEAAKFDKNARKITGFWVPKAENCSSPANKNPSLSGTANPDTKIEYSGSLHDAYLGENLLPVKTVGPNTQPDKGISQSGLSDWTGGTRCAKPNQ